MTSDKRFELSRRKALGAIGSIGAMSAAAGFGTTAFFSDRETFSNNEFVAGELDLKVGWEANYYDWIGDDPETISEGESTDDPGPIVELTDVKPGDVIEKRLTATIQGNPGWLFMNVDVLADEDNGITEPEDDVDDLDGSDGTPGGDLADALNCVLWFDDGDGLPQEIWAGTFPETQEDYVMAVGDADRPSDVFDLSSDRVITSGSLSEIASGDILLNSQVVGVASDRFPDKPCFAAGTPQDVGCLCWLPRDVPGINDNVFQSDRIEYIFGFRTVQCRHVRNCLPDIDVWRHDDACPDPSASNASGCTKAEIRVTTPRGIDQVEVTGDVCGQGGSVTETHDFGCPTETTFITDHCWEEDQALDIEVTCCNGIVRNFTHDLCEVNVDVDVNPAPCPPGCAEVTVDAATPKVLTGGIEAIVVNGTACNGDGTNTTETVSGCPNTATFTPSVCWDTTRPLQIRVRFCNDACDSQCFTFDAGGGGIQ